MQDQLSQLQSMAPPVGVDSGDWEVLRTALARNLAGSHAVRAAPVTVPSAARLSLDDNSLLLNWGYACQGDYDQNSEVNIADLAPLGTNFQEKSSGGSFPPGSLLSMIDGDNNGELNIADLSPIGTNFGRRVKAFNVYRTLNLADLPATTGGPVGPGAELLGSVAYGQSSGNRTIEQLRYSFQLAQAAPGWFYFVRPADGASEGTPSNVVSFGAKPGNLDPLAELLASPQSGNLPLSVSFDASGSSDPDGPAGNINDIILFSWDFDGDGVVDQSTAGPSTSHNYLAAGNFTASVTVFDEEAGSGKASVSISVTAPGNQNPVASFTADPPGGSIPLLVSFDASASTDADGSITSFAWDFNGDGLTDFVGGTPLAQFNYTAAGSFDVRLTVLDDKSASDSTVQTIDAIDSSVNQPPTAVLSIAQPTGDAPQLVRLDASGSSDPDGSVAIFAWDFDGDGDFDAQTVESEIDHNYLVVGDFNPVVRVTDDSGATDEASAPLTIHGFLKIQLPTSGTNELGLSMALVSEHPAIVWTDHAELPQDRRTHYVRALTPEADSADEWPAPITVDDLSGANFPGPILIEAADRPTIICGQQAENSLLLRCNSEDGMDPQDWLDGTEAQVADGFGLQALPMAAAIVNGNPAVVTVQTTVIGFDLTYTISKNPEGTDPGDWNPTILLDSHFAPGEPKSDFADVSLSVVNSRPGIAYLEDPPGPDSKLLYNISQSTDGVNLADWLQEPLILDSGTVGFSPNLVTIAGFPAVVYMDEASNGPRMRLSSDGFGRLISDWQPAFAFGPNDPGLTARVQCSVALAAGVPFIALTGLAPDSPLMMHAVTADVNAAPDWGNLLFPGGSLVIDDQFPERSRIESLEVSGRPAFAYVDSVLQDVVFVLRF